jgi:hypothetical protein
VPFRQNVEGKVLGKGLETVVGYRERMKRVNGIIDRDTRSNFMEILMDDDFAKIKPTDLFKLATQSV